MDPDFVAVAGGIILGTVSSIDDQAYRIRHRHSCTLNRPCWYSPRGETVTGKTLVKRASRHFHYLPLKLSLPRKRRN